jgi:hypothetical protein
MEKVTPIHTNNATSTLDYLHFLKWENVERCFLLIILFVIGFMCINDYILIENLMSENLHLQASLIYQLMHKGNLWVLCIMEAHKPIDLLNFHKLHQFFIKEWKYIQTWCEQTNKEFCSPSKFIQIFSNLLYWFWSLYNQKAIYP